MRVAANRTRGKPVRMHQSKTSVSHPLRIDPVTVGGTRGRIGLTFCPGKKQSEAQSGVWDRSLDDDMKVIKAFGAAALVTLMPDNELRPLRVPPFQIREKASELGIEWYQLPIPDQGTPDQIFEDSWATVGPRLHAFLKAGHNIVVHCKGGLGRTGTTTYVSVYSRERRRRNLPAPIGRAALCNHDFG
jgi:ADP-ribosyl-[dinitrogen reductase] hydrolase